MTGFDKDRWIADALRRGVYHVEADGTVWKRTKVGVRMVKPSVHRPTGRVYFNMTHAGLTKSVLLNRVVALAHLPNPHGHPEVNHRDGDKENNAVSNLEWADRSEQERHAFASHLKSTRGSQNANAKLTAVQVNEIRNRAKFQKMPIEDLASMFNVSARTIRDILNERTWRHV